MHLMVVMVMMVGMRIDEDVIEESKDVVAVAAAAFGDMLI